MIKKFLIAFVFLTSATVFSQKTTLSPYSFFGVGEEFTPVTVEQSAMGGIGVAFNHYKFLNFTNPAAIANLRFTTYSFGALHKDISLKTSAIKQKSSSSTFSYLALGFPIGQKAGFALGIQPVSSVGYQLSNRVIDANNVAQEVTTFDGTGGINRFYGNFGIQVYKGLSLGIEASFNFGNIENSIYNQQRGAFLGTRYEEKTQVRGTSLKIGAQYKHQLKNKVDVTAGVAMKLANTISVDGNNYLYSIAVTGNNPQRDTLSTNVINGNFKLPVKTTFGLGAGKTDKWYAGFEYEMQDAYQPNGFLNSTTNAYRYINSNRLAFGGFYLPKINSISSYFDRVKYSAGVRFVNTGLAVDGSGTNTNFTKIKDFGISFGLGLPLKRQSTLNLGLEYGKRGTIQNNLIQENYFNFRLSLSLTDLWFVKRRID